jgi:hypothetical protein
MTDSTWAKVPLSAHSSFSPYAATFLSPPRQRIASAFGLVASLTRGSAQTASSSPPPASSGDSYGAMEPQQPPKSALIPEPEAPPDFPRGESKDFHSDFLLSSPAFGSVSLLHLISVERKSLRSIGHIPPWLGSLA